MAPFLFLVDAISPLRAVLLSTEDQRQRLRTALDDTWTEQTAGCSSRGGRDARGKPSPGGREVFKVGVGVWLSNVRIFFYFHMLITYNMAQVCATQNTRLAETCIRSSSDYRCTCNARGV